MSNHVPDPSCPESQSIAQQVSGDASFRILTSFRVDAFIGRVTTKSERTLEYAIVPFLFHRDRLVASAIAFGWSHVAELFSSDSGLQRLLKEIECQVPAGDKAEIDHPAAYKIRLTISQTGDVDVQSSQIVVPINPSPNTLTPNQLCPKSSRPPTCRVFVDTQPTLPSVFSTHKTTARAPYENARQRASISNFAADVAEVLLFNTSGHIMEASLSTPYFLRDGRWVTPPLSSGGNAGVTRRHALVKDLCVEEEVTVDSLYNGELLWISNGVRGFIEGLLFIQDVNLMGAE